MTITSTVTIDPNNMESHPFFKLALKTRVEILVKLTRLAISENKQIKSTIDQIMRYRTTRTPQVEVFYD